MAIQLVPVISALIGALIGGFINYFATKSVKEQEWKLTLVKERINRLEKVFSDFLLCSQKLLVQSTEKKISSVADLNLMNDSYSQIELTASQEVIDAAKLICDYVVRRQAKEPTEDTRNFFELKQAFIRSARAELEHVERRRN